MTYTECVLKIEKKLGIFQWWGLLFNNLKDSSGETHGCQSY